MERSAQIPYFDTRLDREHIDDATDYQDIIDILSDPELRLQANAGNVTLAMIRPNVGPDANLLGLSDLECARQVEERITNLGVVTKFSFKFSPDVVQEFYKGAPQETMERGGAENPSMYESRWPEFVDFMSSGPTTALVLYSPNGDAIEQWRSHLGHWNIEKHRDADTIRGSLAVNIFNNLVHGSDEPDSVIREFDLIADQLRRNLDN